MGPIHSAHAVCSHLWDAIRNNDVGQLRRFILFQEGNGQAGGFIYRSCEKSVMATRRALLMRRRTIFRRMQELYYNLEMSFI